MHFESLTTFLGSILQIGLECRQTHKMYAVHMLINYTKNLTDLMKGFLSFIFYIRWKSCKWGLKILE